MKTIRWGIIGCGNVTEVKSGPGFQKVPNSSLVAVMRRNGELAADYARRHGVTAWYDDAQALVDDPTVDAVYVATPPSSHREYTLMAARAGKPVYVEKPMALNHAECRSMIDACREAGVPLFVAYYRRTLPRFVKIKDLIDSGAIGDIRYVTVRLRERPLATDGRDLPWRVLPKIAGGGLFADLASHTLDYLDYVLGPIAKVAGFAANQGGLYPAEDLVTGAFQFRSGVQGAGLWCFTAFDNEDVNEIVGSAGTITFSTFGTEPVRLATTAGVREFPIDHPPHVHQPLIQTVVDELTGRGRCPSRGESAARTSWVMDQMLANYYG